MYIVLVGGSGIGIELAKMLVIRRQKVTMIEKNFSLVTELDKELDILVMEGNGANIEDLKKAKVKSAHMLAALTKNDATNITSCMMAKQLGVPKTIARITDPESIGGKNTSDLSHKKLGIDIVTDPRRAVAEELKERIYYPEATEIDFFAEGKVMMLSTVVSSEADILGKTLNELSLPGESIVVGFKRFDGRFEIARDNSKIQEADEVYIAGQTEVMKDAAWQLHREDISVKRVLILGGGRVGYQLARMLETGPVDDLIIKLIEADPDRRWELNRSLQKTIVLENDYFDEEEIEDADMVVSVTGDDKTNIIALVIAHRKGAKVVSEINDVEYESIYRGAGVETIVNPYVITASQIVRYTRQEEIVSLTILRDEKSECFELSLSPDASVVNKKISQLDLPKNFKIGVLIRENKVHVPCRDTILKPDDHLVVFSTRNFNLFS